MSDIIIIYNMSCEVYDCLHYLVNSYYAPYNIFGRWKNYHKQTGFLPTKATVSPRFAASYGSYLYKDIDLKLKNEINLIINQTQANYICSILRHAFMTNNKFLNLEKDHVNLLYDSFLNSQEAAWQ